MRTIKIFLYCFLFLVFSNLGQAQVNNEFVETEILIEDYRPSRHFLKVNLPSFIVGTYSFQYEIFADKWFSLGLGYKFTPKSGMVFEDQLIKIIEKKMDYKGIESPIKKFLEEFEFSNSTFTPEARFYLGKGFGKGFYLGPFVRIDNAKFNSVYHFTGTLEEYNIDFDGKLTAFGYGLNFGVQYPIGRHFTIDILLGPYLSNVKVDFDSSSNYSMSDADVEILRDELEKIKLPNGDAEFTLTNNSVRAKLSSDNFPNLRFGLMMGYRF